MNRLIALLRSIQQADGSWRFCFESGPMTDAHYMILLKSMGVDSDPLLNQHVKRIANLQQSNGARNLYPDEEEGNLSATIESYYTLLMAGHELRNPECLHQAEQYIKQHGGFTAGGIHTKVLLALTGQLPWRQFSVPLELLLVPKFLPISFLNFVGFAQVHIIPVLLAASRNYRLQASALPDLSHLILASNEQTHSNSRLLERIQTQLKKRGNRNQFHPADKWMECVTSRIRILAEKEAEHFLLNRIEPDGTLASYASSTFLLIYALRALGYSIDHPVLQKAIESLRGLACNVKGGRHIQNSTSTVWDTALLTTALQKAGVPKEDPMVQNAIQYLISTADLTGRTLEFFGSYTNIGLQDPMIRQAASWLFHRQEPEGSWYGRWGNCYLYGTWAAVTGLTAVGIPRLHPSFKRAKNGCFPSKTRMAAGGNPVKAT